MNNEETIIDEQFVKDNASAQENANENPVEETQSKKKHIGEKVAYAGGGFVAGAAVTAATQAMAADSEKEDDADMALSEAPNPKDSPNPEDVIVVTDNGVRVAQVSDDLSFGLAFAEARQQVGPGGVFEWHGKVYGTYYKDEWDAMSPQERADYQASIDYEDVTGADSHATHSDVTVHHVHHVHHEHTYVQDTAQPAVETSGEQQEVDVRIIDAGETDLDGDGTAEYSVLVDCNGHEVLLVDVDRDGVADIAISDIDGDGQISEGEIADISDQNIVLPTDSPNDTMYAHNDMPDYMNDADAGLYMG